MTVEIGALLSKEFGDKVLEELNDFEGVKSITVMSGRSSDLFEEKQFGTFGEAAIVSIIADAAQKDKEDQRSEENCLFRTCYRVVNSQAFTAFIAVCIVMNVIFLALDRHTIQLRE